MLKPIFDMQIHLGDLILTASFLFAAWRFTNIVRDTMRNLKMTVYGSKEPPVVGLVDTVERHEKLLGNFLFVSKSARDIEQ